MYLFGNSRATRFIAAFALGSIFLFVFGIEIFSLGYTNMMRYYWFRFPDVIIPLISAALVASIIENVINGYSPFRALSFKSLTSSRSMLTRVIPLLLALGATFVVLNSTVKFGSKIMERGLKTIWKTSHSQMFQWINNNTSTRDIFLIDPTIQDFYINAQRAEFVSFKHSPGSYADIIEWYKRIKLCNKGKPPKKTGFASFEELSENFYTLDEDAIRDIAKSYRIRYYLGLTEQKNIQ